MTKQLCLKHQFLLPFARLASNVHQTYLDRGRGRQRRRENGVKTAWHIHKWIDTFNPSKVPSQDKSLPRQTRLIFSVVVVGFSCPDFKGEAKQSSIIIESSNIRSLAIILACPPSTCPIIRSACFIRPSLYPIKHYCSCFAFRNHEPRTLESRRYCRHYNHCQCNTQKKRLDFWYQNTINRFQLYFFIL